MTTATLTVVAAAVRSNHDGQVHSLPAPKRHHDVILHLCRDLGHPRPITGEQGFVLSDGTFVGRREAARVAVESGQIERPSWPPRLYSEDLW